MGDGTLVPPAVTRAGPPQRGDPSAPEKAGRRSGGSPLLCGEEPCGIEPSLRRGNTGWRATERERPVRNPGLPCGEPP